MGATQNECDEEVVHAAVDQIHGDAGLLVVMSNESGDISKLSGRVRAQ